MDDPPAPTGLENERNVVIDWKESDSTGDASVGVLSESPWKRLPRRRAKDIVASIGLLAMVVVVSGLVFVINDPLWMRWSVGLVLMFNLLVATRLALCSTKRRPTSKS